MIGRVGVHDDAERIEPATAEEWAAWLAEHHGDRPGVWLVAARREADRAVTYEEQVVEALRWGWVDSTVRPVDEQRAMMWFSPRRRGSVWTRNNKQRVARLEAEGRMEAPGAAAVEAARASGMWTLMDPVEDLVVPDDLAAALAARPGAREQLGRRPPVGTQAGAGVDRAGEEAGDAGSPGRRDRGACRGRRPGAALSAPRLRRLSVPRCPRCSRCRATSPTTSACAARGRSPRSGASPRRRGTP